MKKYSINTPRLGLVKNSKHMLKTKSIWMKNRLECVQCGSIARQNRKTRNKPKFLSFITQ